MSTTTMVHVRVDEEVKAKATAALEAMGLSVSDAVRVFLTRVAAEKALPFEVRVPNELTAKTLEASERGEDLTVAKDAADLMKKLLLLPQHQAINQLNDSKIKIDHNGNQ